MSAAPSIIAGFGLFFVGIRLIGDHMQQMATRRVRQYLGKAMLRPGVAPLAGFGLGALVQSTTGVTFIVMSLLASGLLAMAPAMSVLAWSNVGTSVLVVLSTFNLKTMALYLLGLIGLSYFQGYDKAPRTKHLVTAALGVALLFLGLSLVKDGVEGVRGDPWVEEFVLFAGESGTIALLVGLVLAVAAQSSATVTILGLPLVSAGILDEPQMILIVYGASVGSGLGVMLLSSNLDGTARQLALFQSCLKLLAAAVFVPLHLIEQAWHVPLVQAGAQALSSSSDTRIALVYVLFQIGAALLGWIFRAPLARMLAALSPPTEQETLMRPQFLFDEAIGDPDTALALVDREQARLLSFLPAYLDGARPESERSADALPLATRHGASTAVADETDIFLSEVLAANPGYDGVDRVFEARSRLHTLQSLQTCLHDFARHATGLSVGSDHSLGTSLVESLHLLLTMVAEISQTGDSVDRALLDELTSDRSDMMDGIRKQLLGEASTASVREAFLVATMLFERAVWLVRELRLATAEDVAEPAR
ncbi:Na/Pi symporter [Emcibacter sp. SYSU 3D8]|uniref:Na/Pi cotransporter family protein n=1 Tax=Emcibacter sp. SYSU 3D8 TaxID=3133969 RepID=UPI0031FE89BE